MTQVVEHAEQMVGFGGGQRRRRFVEHENAAVEGEGSGHLYELTVRGGEPPHLRVRRERQMQAREEVAGAQAHLALEQDATATGQLAAGEDVAADGEVGKRHHLLVDHPNPVRERVARACGRQALVVQPDLAAVRRDDAGENLEERRFAGAVLSHQGVRLARVHGKAHAVERPHGPE